MAKSKEKEIAPILQGATEGKEEWIQRIRYSARGYKAHFTAVRKSTMGKCKFVVNSPSDFGVQQLKLALGELENALYPLKFRLQELLASADNEDDFKDYEKDLNSYMEIYTEHVEYVMEAIEAATKELLPKAQVAPAAPAAAAAPAADPATRPPQIKANAVLKLSLIHI